jgi:energy-coupling factor transporter ATP-binding protein EcfA2
LRRSIGVTFQFPERQFFRASVQEELADVLQVGGEDADERRIEAALHDAGLPASEFLKRSPYSLSMGEGRRLALALLWLQRPGLLLLDEPTAGLDADGIRRVVDMIRSMRERNVTVLFVSHDLDVLAGVVGRAIVLSAGRVLADGTTDELLCDGALLAGIGFDAPAVVALAEQGRRLGADIPPGIPSAGTLQAAFANLRAAGSPPEPRK